MSDQSPHVELPKRGRPPKLTTMLGNGFDDVPTEAMETTKALDKMDGNFQALAAQLMTLAGVARMQLVYDRFTVTIERT